MMHLGFGILGMVLQIQAPIAAATDPPGIHVLTAEQLSQAGVVRIADIFSLADGWASHSTNGYTVDAAVIGTAPWDVPVWKLFVDDARLDLRQLGHQDINAVPITLLAVCSVELHSQPVVIGGEYAGAGAVHIRTCTPALGVAAKVMAAGGSATGDPGPFKYTPLGAANVDRSGPHLQGSVSIARPTWHARLQGRVDEHHSTDPRIRERARTLYIGEKDARVFHRSVHVDLARREGTSISRIYAGAVRFEDLSYYELMALEVPVNHNLVRYGASTQRELARNWQINGMLQGDRQSLQTRANSQSVILDREHTVHRAYARAQKEQGRARTAIGLGSAIIQAIGHQSTAFGRVDYRLMSHWELSGELHVTYARQALGYAVSTTLQWQGADRHRLRVRVTGEQQQVSVERPLWFWMQEGFDESRFTRSRLALPPANRNVKVHLDWDKPVREGLHLTLSTAYGRYWGVAAGVHKAAFDPATTRLIVDPALRDSWGNVVAMGARMHVSLRNSLEIHLFGQYSYQHSADPTFVQGMRRHPGWSGSLTAQVRPMPRMRLFGRLTTTDPTWWMMYRDAARSAGHLYASTLPSVPVLNLNVEKFLWQDHLRLGASLRNVLNRSYPRHPAGPVSNLAAQFYLRASL